MEEINSDHLKMISQTPNSDSQIQISSKIHKDASLSISKRSEQKRYFICPKIVELIDGIQIVHSMLSKNKNVSYSNINEGTTQNKDKSSEKKLTTQLNLNQNSDKFFPMISPREIKDNNKNKSKFDPLGGFENQYFKISSPGTDLSEGGLILHTKYDIDYDRWFNFRRNINRQRLQYSNAMKKMEKQDYNKVQVKYYTKVNNPVHFYEFYPEKLYCLDNNDISIQAQKIKITQPKLTKEKKLNPKIKEFDKNIRESNLNNQILKSKFIIKAKNQNESSQQKSLVSDISNLGINLLTSKNSKKRKSSSLLPITFRPKSKILSFTLKRNAKSPLKLPTNEIEDLNIPNLKNRTKIRTNGCVKKGKQVMPTIKEESSKQDKKIVKYEKESKQHIPTPIKKEVNEEKSKPKQKFVYVPMDLAYTYIILQGNNSGIVKRCFEKRNSDWKELPSYNSTYNFKWQMPSNGLRFEQLSCNGYKQLVNHFEYHTEISNKDNLFKNLYNYCELNKINVFSHVPLTFVIDLEEKSFNSDLEKFIKVYNIINHLIELSESSLPDYEEVIASKVNSKISNFSVSKDRRVVTHSKLILNSTHISNKNIWILKPTGFNRGRGVTVFNNIDSLKKCIKELSEGMEERSPFNKTATEENNEENKNTEIIGVVKSQTFVIQKYIERPILINQRKFDIRIWVLVNHMMKVYLFKEGYLRTSSEIFSLNSENVDKRSVHLTNNAVQKYCEGYGNFEDGNQLSFQQFQEYLDNAMPQKEFSVRNNLYVQMKEKVNLSMQSVRKKLNQNERYNCFEIFGYDFIVDCNFNAWLIEINTNPCLEESSKLLKMLLPRMLDDAFKLSLDEIFPKRNKNIDQGEVVFPVEGYKNDENLWDYICQIGLIKANLKMENILSINSNTQRTVVEIDNTTNEILKPIEK